MRLMCFLYFFVFTNIRSEPDLFRPKTVRIYQIQGTCPEVPNPKMYFSDVQMVNLNRTVYISMKTYIRSNINNDVKLWLYLSRCDSRDALDSCETYKTMKINNFCQLLNGKNTPWASLVGQYSPPLKCPLKKGIYEAKNSTFDGSAFNRFPVLNWYWKILVNIRDDVTDEILLCSTLEGQIAPI